jgi:TonB family protein
MESVHSVRRGGAQDEVVEILAANAAAITTACYAPASQGAGDRTVVRRILLGVMLSLLASAAAANGPGAVRKQVESSMLVTGTIDIATDGGVRSFRLDKEDKLPAEVIQLARQAVPEWRFEPVVIDGQAVTVSAKMSMRIVASRLGENGYRLTISSAAFGRDALAHENRKPDGTTLQRDDMHPPMYPRGAAESGITGIVYLLVRIGRDGKVEDVATEQVNLTVIGSEITMQRGRKSLESAALYAARRWTFKPPTVGDAADDPYWKVRVPIAFQIDETRAAAYGEWEAYVPGPQMPPPSWVEQQDVATSPDALLDGEVHALGDGPRLLTPLG